MANPILEPTTLDHFCLLHEYLWGDLDMKTIARHHKMTYTKALKVMEVEYDKYIALLRNHREYFEQKPTLKDGEVIFIW